MDGRGVDAGQAPASNRDGSPVLPRTELPPVAAPAPTSTTSGIDGRAVARLAGELAGAAGGGDIEAARELHRQIGALLGAPAARRVVLDLEAERRRRAGGDR